MASLSAMIQLEIPHINILSKMDLVSNKKDVEEGTGSFVTAEQTDGTRLSHDILPWRYCIQYVLSHIDNCIQYGEDADVKVRDFDPEED
uniref:GPN-loop GTPase 3 n=1 Tax=Oryza punctata TaxID=4537 RepID=A0A0E0KI86_ORYPU